jgi:hypothetical protein
MFRWYGAAARCYVYLSDVPDLQDPTATVESAFAMSRWFKRGWTLQELVAPKKVEFFSRNGKSLGVKESRVQQIREITGIPFRTLQGKPISQFSIADRMSWAARRETTREEVLLARKSWYVREPSPYISDTVVKIYIYLLCMAKDGEMLSLGFRGRFNLQIHLAIHQPYGLQN